MILEKVNNNVSELVGLKENPVVVPIFKQWTNVHYDSEYMQNHSKPHDLASSLIMYHDLASSLVITPAYTNALGVATSRTKGGDEVRESEGESDEEETREEEDENFDQIPRTPEESKEESNDEEEQDLRLRVESIFTTTSSPIVSLETPTPIMTPSTNATITTSGEAPIPPPTIPSIILENLPTFNSAFRFEERLRLLETSFSEYRQTNQFADAVSAIPGIVHQYMDQQMKEAVQGAV
nr:hypothetical protein [Tanacetum cinerariifolium]